MTKVMIIGLDGGTFDLIKPWVAEGRLPNLGKLLADGTHGDLLSTVPPMTFPAWNAFMTGKNPGKHGVYDFTEREDHSYSIRFTNALNRKAKTLWQLVSEAGKTVAAIGVPVTYPPEKVNGIVISGFDAPGFSTSSVHPPELYAELNDKVGGYIIAPDIASQVDGDRIDEAVDTIMDVLRQRTRVCRYLLGLKEWDCFMVVFMESDVVCHHFWHYHDINSPHRGAMKKTRYEDPVRTVYEALDKALGEIVESAGEGCIRLVVSDHGFGGTGDRIIYVNRWLRNQGFCTFKESQHRKALPGPGFLKSGFGLLKSIATRVIPVRLRKKLAYSKRFNIVNRIESSLRFSHIDWGRTIAFSEETPYYPSVWINLKGREPEGIVESGDYERVRETVIEGLQKWKDEDGTHLVKKAYKREELYTGEYVYKAPDIIIDWNLDRNGYSHLSRSSYSDRGDRAVAGFDRKKDNQSRFLFSRTGSHRKAGVFIMEGAPVKKGLRLGEIKMTDVAPTILYLLGMPIAGDMDGSVLTEAFEESYVRQHPVNRSDHGTDTSGPSHDGGYYSDDEEEKIRERLKGLGYI